MNKIVKMVDPEEQASRLFSEHVQNIAFNLTLSRRMVGLLEAVRDFGFPSCCGDNDLERRRFYYGVTQYGNGAYMFIKYIRAIENRGLVIHQFNQEGKPTFVLSKAGKLVCELLVECGLMSRQRIKIARGSKT